MTTTLNIPKRCDGRKPRRLSGYDTQDNGTTARHIEIFNQDISEKIIDALTTLTKTVADLATQVAELKKEPTAR